MLMKRGITEGTVPLGWGCSTREGAEAHQWAPLGVSPWRALGGAWLPSPVMVPMTPPAPWLPRTPGGVGEAAPAPPGMGGQWGGSALPELVLCVLVCDFKLSLQKPS